MLPTCYFAHPHHQQSSGRQALGQAVENLAATPATKIDQQVLTKNNVHTGHGCLGQLEYIEPRAAHARRQIRQHFETSIILSQEVALAEVSIQLLQTACAILTITRLTQRIQADIGACYAEMLRILTVT